MIQGVPTTVNCQIAVVGAGPSGSAAAYYLSAAGFDVCLIDRSTFPRDKVCGDLLGEEAIAELAKLGLEPEADWYGRFARVSRWRAVGYTGKIREGSLKVNGGQLYVIRRTDFDDTLRRRAIAMGARWLSPCRCDHLTRDASGVFILRGVASNKIETQIRADVVIYANGAGSACDVSSVSEIDERVGVAGRAYYDNVNVAETCEFYYLDYLPLRYAWIFPLPGGLANVGVGMSLRALREQHDPLELVLSRVIERVIGAHRSFSKARRVLRFQGAVLKTGLQPGRLIRDGVIYIGDAAGMANPWDGEGIGPALVSARLAAQAICSAWRQGIFKRDEFRGYEEATRMRYGEVYDRAQRMFTSRKHLCQLLTPA